MNTHGEDMTITLREKAEYLGKLHYGPRILILPNAWDIATARIVEEAGFPVIATSSAGIAASLGYPDGQHITRTEMLGVVARIVRAVRIPVTADMEGGYGLTPGEMAETAKAVIDAGAVGLNIEDTIGHEEDCQVNISLQVRKLHAIREAAASKGVPLVLNARTDIYLLGIGDPATRFERTVERLRAYRDAGADCLFAPGIRDSQTIEKLVAALRAPLNILGGPGSPSVPELERLGVARLSVGSGIFRAALTKVRDAAKELLEAGTYNALDHSISHADVNSLLGRGLN